MMTDILTAAREKRARKLAADLAGVEWWRIAAQQEHLDVIEGGPHIFVLTDWSDSYHPYEVSYHRTPLGAYLAAEGQIGDYGIHAAPLED